VVGSAQSPTSIFSPAATPASEVRSLSFFVLTVTGCIFLTVAALLTYVLVRYRGRAGDHAEPPQVFGSTQIELAWTIIPTLLLTVLFLGTARILFSVQDAPKSTSALDVVAIGHQFWWEFRYPKYNVVTANELHVPVNDPKHPTTTFIKLTSADVIHSFWVPELAGKTDLVPNRVNEMWIDPHTPGMYEGQCAQFCGSQHAKMLLRVYVDTPEEFRKWIENQQKTQESGTTPQSEASLQKPNPGPQAGIPPNTPQTFMRVSQDDLRAITPKNGRRVFEQQACINCHTISGTVANGRYGPDLTHLMSRDTIASGAALNTPANLKLWITDPNIFKPGSLMPAMHLTDRQNEQITAYMTTLK
jgi:cytochrome c oxidase subunit 2